METKIKIGDFVELTGSTLKTILYYHKIGLLQERNQGVVPEEVYLLNEIGELRDRLAYCVSQDVKITLNKKLEEVKLKYNLVSELKKCKK